jgi:hypothetical protein
VFGEDFTGGGIGGGDVVVVDEHEHGFTAVGGADAQVADFGVKSENVCMRWRVALWQCSEPVCDQDGFGALVVSGVGRPSRVGGRGRLPS